MYKEHCWPSEACQDGPGWRELQYCGAGTDSLFLAALPVELPPLASHVDSSPETG